MFDMKQWRKEHPNYRKEWCEKNPNYYKDYAQKNKKHIRQVNQQWYQRNREHALENNKRYRQTENGRLITIKVAIKSVTKRRRNMLWIPMFENPFGDSEIVDWHHINNAYVVAIPRDLHKFYGGKYHKEMTMEIVKQIYLGN